MLDLSILTALRGRRALVTGGTGMVGREVVDRLVEAGCIVRVASLDEMRPNAHAEYLRTDLTDARACDAAVAGNELVLHIAGIKGSVSVTTARPASFFVPLLLVNTTLLEAARRAQIPKLVYTSSIGAYPSRERFVEEDAWAGEPMDTFPGWAKRMGELQIQAYRRQYNQTGWSIVRLTNVYGIGDNFDPASAMVIPALMARVAAGEDPLVVWGDGSAIREFAWAGDIAEGIIRALHFGTAGEPINLGTGEGITIRQLVETLAEVVPFRFEFDPSKPAGFPCRMMDVTRAREQLGFVATTPLREGLERTWRWFTENQNEHQMKQNYFQECA